MALGQSATYDGFWIAQEFRDPYPVPTTSLESPDAGSATSLDLNSKF